MFVSGFPWPGRRAVTPMNIQTTVLEEQVRSTTLCNPQSSLVTPRIKCRVLLSSNDHLLDSLLFSSDWDNTSLYLTG